MVKLKDGLYLYIDLVFERLSQLFEKVLMTSSAKVRKVGTSTRLWNTPRVITTKIILKKMTNASEGAYSIPTTPSSVDMAPCKYDREKCYSY